MDWKKPSAEEVRRFEAALPDDPRVKRAMMFGLPHGKVGDHMFAGRHGTGITVRLPEEDRAKLLGQGAKLFEPMPGRPMKEWVLLSPEMAGDAATLGRWVKRAFEYTAALPPKGSGKAPRSKASSKTAAAAKPKAKAKSKPKAAARSKRA